MALTCKDCRLFEPLTIGELDVVLEPEDIDGIKLSDECGTCDLPCQAARSGAIVVLADAEACPSIMLREGE